MQATHRTVRPIAGVAAPAKSWDAWRASNLAITRNRARISAAILRCAFPTLLWVGIAATSSNAGQKVYVGTKSVSGSVSLSQVDHSTWGDLTKRYVDPEGAVDYRTWKSNAKDVQLLDNYLAILSTGNPRAQNPRDSQLAFWINAYNAVTIRGMLREYPTSSIRNHTARLYGYNIWDDLQLYVGGRPYSLNQMEHDILRGMGEPRIHFALVCAAKGCPRLLNTAYLPANVQSQLESNTLDFFKRPQNFRHDGSKFYLSAILKWYGGDFGSGQAAQLRGISTWLPTPAARHAAKNNAVGVRYMAYDWSLNEQSQG